jgi:hypothetical protein
MTQVTDFLELAYPDVIRNVHYRDNWGSVTWLTERVNRQVTWLDLYKIADDLIEQSGDNHHIFIEGFDYDNGDLYLITGS